MEKISNSLDSENDYSREEFDLISLYFGEAEQLPFDKEGRIILPKKLINHAQIENNVLFVGLGKTFQIWEPKNFEKFKTVARKKAYQNRSNLKWETKQKGEL